MTRQPTFLRREPVEWNDQLVHEITSVSNPISTVVDFWVDSILQGYITEFAVDTITSYSKAKRNFFQGPHIRYLLSISTWIKMLIYEKGILWLSSWVAWPWGRLCCRWYVKKMGEDELNVPKKHKTWIRSWIPKEWKEIQIREKKKDRKRATKS